MPTIANLNVKPDGSFEGTLATLNVIAPIAIVATTPATIETLNDAREPLAPTSVLGLIAQTGVAYS